MRLEVSGELRMLPILLPSAQGGEGTGGHVRLIPFYYIRRIRVRGILVAIWHRMAGWYGYCGW